MNCLPAHLHDDSKVIKEPKENDLLPPLRNERRIKKFWQFGVDSSAKKRPGHEKKKKNIRREEKEGRRKSKKENCQAKLQEVVIPLPGRRVC